jgi:hypothetical protein
MTRNNLARILARYSGSGRSEVKSPGFLAWRGEAWRRCARLALLIAMAALPLGGCVAVDLLEWAGEEIHCQPTGFFVCPPAKTP